MKRKLFFAALCAIGALGGQLRAQNAPILAELNDFGGVTVSSLSTFAPAGTTYTLEVTGCVANQAINVTAGSFSYTPTADGTVRFVRVNDNVYVYENSEYKGTATLSTPTITYPEIFLNVTDDATAKTGIYAESNLISNPGFETWSEDFDDYNHKATNWDCNGYAYNNRSRVRSNAKLSEQEGSSTFFIHGYGNPAECLSQTISGLQSFTPYKIQFLTWRHEQNANFDVTIGTSAGDGSIYTGTVSVPSSGSKNQSLTFTTGSLSADSYVFAITRKSTNGMGDFDRMTMVAATDGIGITGATGASFLAGTAYAPEGTVSFENGQDITSLITNAAVVGGSNNSLSGWTNGRSNSGQQYTVAPDNYYMDTWNATLDQKQTIALPAGYYLLKAATRADANVTDGNIYAYANGANLNSVQIHKEGSTGNLLGNGWGWTRVPFSVDDVTSVTIGFYSVCGSSKWAGADNFTLTYYDSQASLDAALLTGAKEDAAAWKTRLNGTIPTGGINVLQAAIDNAEATAATVETAISTARAMVAPYDAYKAAKVNMDAITAVAVTDNTAKATRKDALDAICDAVEAATDAATITSKTAEINPAILNYIKKLTPADAVNAPFDLTFLITNPSFSTNAMTGWTGTMPNFGNDATQKAAYACEYYEKEFDIYQTLTDMVTGNYRLKVKAYQRPGGSGTIVPAYVNAEDKKDGTFGTTSEIYVNGGNEASQAIKNAASPMLTANVGKGSESGVDVNGTKYYIPNDMVSAVAYFNAGYYENEAEILATASTIKFGFRSTANHDSADWTIFDDFRLYYTGQLDLSIFQTSLDAKVAEANTTKTALTGKIPAAALTALQNAIDANDNDDSAFEEEEQFTEAIDNLTAAIAAAEALQEPYAAYVAQRTMIQALYDVADYEELTTGAHTVLGTALTDAATNVETATTVEGINTVASTLTAAAATYAGNANPTDDAKFDLTFMLTNPDLSGYAAWKGGIEGWYTDQNFETQNFQTMNEDTKMFMEYWSAGSNPTDGYTLCQKVTLPKGTYNMEAECKAGWGSAASNPDGKQAITFSANDIDGTNITSTSLAAASIEFVQASESEVKIGLKAHDGNTCNWMGIGYVKLYKVPASSFTLNENTEFTPVDKAGDVTLTKSIYKGFNTIVLPFGVDAETVTSQLGEGTLYKFTDADEGSLNFETATTIVPHTPYLFKTANDDAIDKVMNFMGVTISTGTPITAGTDYNFVGTYTPYAKGADANPIVVGADYVLGNDDAFHLTTAKNALKAFRAYIQANESTSEAKPRLAIKLNGEATAIESIDGERVNVFDGRVYDLSGRSVKNPTKGLYIVNGKKIMVK